MCHICHTTCIHLGNSSDFAQKLNCKPYANEENGGYQGDVDENPKEEYRPDTIAREGRQKGSHHGSDGTACTQVRDGGSRINRNLGQGCRQSSEEVKG